MGIKIGEVKHYCVFCEAFDRSPVETSIGGECPVCHHFLTCERESGCDNSCEFYGDPYNMDGDCLLEK